MQISVFHCTTLNKGSNEGKGLRCSSTPFRKVFLPNYPRPPFPLLPMTDLVQSGGVEGKGVWSISICARRSQSCIMTRGREREIICAHGSSASAVRFLPNNSSRGSSFDGTRAIRQKRTMSKGNRTLNGSCKFSWLVGCTTVSVAAVWATATAITVSVKTEVHSIVVVPSKRSVVAGWEVLYSHLPA